MEALRPRLPELPWFVFVEKERLVWQEHCSLQILEKKSDALRAEAAGAWSRAARLWTDLGDAARAGEARQRWIETLRDPVRQARAWVAAGEPGRAVQTLEATGSELAKATVAAWQAERDGRWSEAASLWHSIGRHHDESRCLARAEQALLVDSPQLPDGDHEADHEI
jgi:hypothetical protein